MSTINRLSSVDVLQPSDQIPVWDSSNGDTRKASMSTLLAFVESYFADPDYSTRIVAPAVDYFTVDIGATGDSIWMIVNPTLNFSTGAITLPSTAYAVNDQEITVVFTAAVVNFSITSSGATVLGAPTQIGGYDSFRVRYNASQQTWYTLDTTGDGAGSGVSQIVRQDFTGDGATTTFTLTTAPSSSGNELQTFIDGVYQERSGYTVTGSNIVFSEAPPSLSTIEVLGWSITIGAETTSDLVSYEPAGTGAVLTTVQAKLRESLSVKDFGAVGDGVADDTAAVQAAFTAALSSSPIKSVEISGKCRITASIKIDRPIPGGGDLNDVATWFMIRGIDGGSLYVDTAITVFDSDQDYSVRPNTAQVHVENLIIELSNPAVNAYVMSGAFLRINFLACSFYKIKFFAGVTSPQFSQSVYLDKCVARKWTGVFFENSLSETYDLKVMQCQIEAPTSSGDCFNLGTANGVSFTDNTIEGILGSCINYKGSNGLNISGNYFENSTGPEIDGTSSTGSTFNFGVLISGNHFENGGVAKTFCIGWSPYTYGGVSIGNGAVGALSGTILLHQLPPSGTEASISIINDAASVGTLLSDESSRTFFVDKTYPAKSGYVYGSSSDGDAVSLKLGVFYNSATLTDVLEITHLNQTNLNGVDFKPAYLNMKADIPLPGISIKSTDVGNGSTYAQFLNSANGSAGAITQTGVSSVNYGVSSDYRLKENVVALVNATEKVKQLLPKQFNFIGEDSTTDGFIAHEVQVVVPKAVVGQKDGVDSDGNAIYQSIDHGKLIPLLVATIQELEARIANLENQ